MTEQEAIERIRLEACNEKGISKFCHDNCVHGKRKCTYGMAIDTLKEIQQYRDIGTVEECQEARELQNPKRPNMWGDGCDDEGGIIYDMYDCPNCGTTYEIDYEKHDFCPNCGQKLDWSDEE